MTSHWGFHPWTNDIIIKGLKILNNKMQERKTFIINNISIDHQLVTAEIDKELQSLVRLWEYLAPSPTLVELSDISYDYIRSGVLFYRDELNRAMKVAGENASIRKEIEEVDRILGLESIRTATNNAFDKYSSSANIIQKETKSDTVDMVDQIIDSLEALNVFSKHKLGCTIFKSNAKLLKDLKHQADNEPEFIFTIAVIATLIDEVHHDEILKYIKEKPESGSINLIERLFVEKDVQNYKSAITKLRLLHRLRSTKYPIHDKEHEAIGILKELGIAYPINWKEAGNVCVNHFIESIKELVESVRNYK